MKVKKWIQNSSKIISGTSFNNLYFKNFSPKLLHCSFKIRFRLRFMLHRKSFLIDSLRQGKDEKEKKKKKMIPFAAFLSHLKF